MRDWLYPYYCGAGLGAQAKYKEVSGRWRKRVFRRPWLIYVVHATPIAVLGFVEHANMWLWGFGVFLGILVGAYVALLESPPAYIENWRAGYEGERRTARALAALRRDGYVLLHDLPDRRVSGQDRKGNIDHVVVSTAGVFLLDSKWLGGEVSIDGDVIHVQMRDDDDDSYDLDKLARGMRGRAIRLQEDIKHQAGVHFVQAVVVFWNKFDGGLVIGDSVVFVHGEQLVEWLREQKPRMTAERVAHVAACIRDTRPPEHRGWWSRLPKPGLRGRGVLVAPPAAGGAARES